jgi:lipopolysaccharide biosynthesis glycosyltransferase
VEIIPLNLRSLPYKETHSDGSNEFIYSRFLVPYLCNYEGWAIWMDGDMVVKGDIAELWNLRDEEYAVQVVKHDYKTKHAEKYLGNVNQDYPKKNWSSVVLFNNSRCYALTPKIVEQATGSFLHRFSWLQDSEIGSLPVQWNWLVGEYEHNDDAKLLHYTIGIPAFSEYVKCDHSEDWWQAYKDMTYCASRNSKASK